MAADEMSLEKTDGVHKLYPATTTSSTFPKKGIC